MNEMQAGAQLSPWGGGGRLRPTGCLHGNRQQPPGPEAAPGKSVTKQFLEVAPRLRLWRGEGGVWLAPHPGSRPDLMTPHLPSVRGGCAGARPPLATHPLQ